MLLSVRSPHCAIDSACLGTSPCREDGLDEDRCLPFISRFCGVTFLVIFIRGASGFEVVEEDMAGVLVPEGTGDCAGTEAAPSLLGILVTGFSSIGGLEGLSDCDVA